jgi:hypothetical protein
MSERVFTLENKYLAIQLSHNGCLLQIHDKMAGDTYPLLKDTCRVLTDAGFFENENRPSQHVEERADTLSFFFTSDDSVSLMLCYQLRPEDKYFKRGVEIRCNDKPLTLYRVILGDLAFREKPEEMIDYRTFWYAPTVCFIRRRKAGLFTGIENPFFHTEIEGNRINLYYEPSLILNAGESYESEHQFLGVYTRSGQMLTDHWPKTLVSCQEGNNRPRFRNPCGHIPLDWNEIRAMGLYASDYLEVNTDRFMAILYGFWYPIEQMPQGEGIEEKYKRVLDNFCDVGGDMVIFNPLHKYNRPLGNEDGFWELAPEGTSAQRLLEYARSKGLRFGFYMGVAAHGQQGNACALPFAPERAEWKKVDFSGTPGDENCLACDEYLDWWYSVQCNTIRRYTLSFWSWDPGPGNGNHCYSDQHGHLPGKGEYKGWRNSLALLKRMKAEFPDLYLMSYYGRKEYGLWGFKYFNQQECYWEQTILYGGTVHPDLHDDRVNADGVRLQNWWNVNFRFLPSMIGHGLVHRIGEHAYDPALTKVWDHGGWKYALLSALACSGSITLCILPEKIEQVKGFTEFYRYWLAWAGENFDYVKYNIPFGEQVRTGGIDGYARIKENRGFIFLCNPGPRTTRIRFHFGENIGLYQAGFYTLKMIYPTEQVCRIDGETNPCVFQKDDEIICDVPAYEVMILELSPMDNTFIAGTSASVKYIRIEPNPETSSRELDGWTMPDHTVFQFPFHAKVENLTLKTKFFAAEAIKELLKINKPANIEEVEPLLEKWVSDGKNGLLPHNFAWARPDRLWLVIPFEDANRVEEVKLICNGVDTAIRCFTLNKVRIIYYTDLTDALAWGKVNGLELHIKRMDANQYLGPFLDYPRSDIPMRVKVFTEIKSTNERVYTRVIADPPDPSGSGSVKPNTPPPCILWAQISPGEFSQNGGPFSIRAGLNLPVEEIRGVYFSNGSLPEEIPLHYNEIVHTWICDGTIGCRSTTIFDSPLGKSYLWAVDIYGRVSEPYAVGIRYFFQPK